MIKSKLEKELIKANDGKLFISLENVRKIVGMGRGEVRNVLKDLDYIQFEDKRQKKYLISDVAEAFMEYRRS